MKACLPAFAALALTWGIGTSAPYLRSQSFPPGKVSAPAVTRVSTDAPTVALPTSAKGKAGAWIVVTAKVSDGTGPVTWYYPDPGLDEVDVAGLFGPDVAAKLRGRVFTSEKAGQYRVVAFVADKTGAISAPAVCLVTVGDPPPPAPPAPPAPAPDDELTAKLRGMYDTDATGTKFATKAALAALYRQTAAAVKQNPPNTAQELFTIFKAAADATVPAGLMGLRTYVGAELSKVLPTDPTTVLSDKHRADAAALYLKLAASLEAIK